MPRARHAATTARLTGTKRRLVDRLKRLDSATAGELAGEFGLTDTAVRQHLEALEAAGLVARAEGTAAGRGRPAARWRLTAEALAQFPDRHVDLTLELIDAVRSTLGAEALDQVLAVRAQRQTAAYRAVVGDGPVAVRVRRLAQQRSAEGYEAEVLGAPDDVADDVADEPDAPVVLVEHHCPICVAATSCQQLCASELDVFQAALGDDVVVTREQHLLAGDQRCAYRVTPVETRSGTTVRRPR